MVQVVVKMDVFPFSWIWILKNALKIVLMNQHVTSLLHGLLVGVYCTQIATWQKMTTLNGKRIIWRENRKVWPILISTHLIWKKKSNILFHVFVNNTKIEKNKLVFFAIRENSKLLGSWCPKPANQNVWFDVVGLLSGLYFEKKVPTHAGARAANPGGIPPGAKKYQIVFLPRSGETTMVFGKNGRFRGDV